MRKMLVAFATIIFFIVSPAVVMGHLGETITCYLATEPVTIDGKWTTKSEWNDTAETKLLVAAGSGQGYFRIKHDASWLYVLAESLVNTGLEYDSTTQHGDFMQVYLDTLHDDGKKPNTDDYAFRVFYVNMSYAQLDVRNGTGTDWSQSTWVEGYEAALGLDTGNSPHAPYPHVVGEFRVPLSIVESTTFGFFIRGPTDSSEAETMHFYWPGPSTADQKMDPSTWGNVSLSATAIPEFSAAWLIAALSMLAAPVMLRSKKRTRPPPKP